MLRQRILQMQAEVEVAQQQLASYRAYQQRELAEVSTKRTSELLYANPSHQFPAREEFLAEPVSLMTAGKACG